MWFIPLFLISKVQEQIISLVSSEVSDYETGTLVTRILGLRALRAHTNPAPNPASPTPWDNLIISVCCAHPWLGLRHNYPWLRTVVLRKVGR